ncbi:unnamed protein product, partial [Rotaria magnacalcarata]
DDHIVHVLLFELLVDISRTNTIGILHQRQQATTFAITIQPKKKYVCYILLF